MRLDLWPLQEKIVAALDNDPAIKNAGIRVYDEVPKRAPLPFIAFGEEQVSPSNTKVSTGEEDTFTINLWSAYRGKKQVKKMMSDVTTAIYLMSSQLSTGSRITYMELASADIIEEEQENLYHGVMKFKFVIRH